MTSTFARRLTTQSVLTMSVSLAVLATIVALVALLASVAAQNARAELISDRVEAVLSAANVRSGDAEAAMRALSPALHDPSIHVWAANATERVVAENVAGDVRLRRLPRTETEYDAAPLDARLATAIATAAGTRTYRIHARDLYVYVGSDEERFERLLAVGGVTFLATVLAIVAISYGAGRRLTADALRPLHAVTTTLERVAAGDLAPQPVDPAGGDDLARLGRASNAALARIATAFEERDRAEAQTRRFFADATHQLRTPLTVVQGFVTMLEGGTLESPGERSDALRLVGEQTRTMSQLIGKLVRLEQWESPEPPERRIVRLDELVRDTVLPFATTHPQRGIELDAPKRLYVSCAPRELEEAIANAMDNAVKYAAPAAIAVRVTERGERAIVEIADNGPGIGDADPSRLFERFYRGERRDVAGSGLGLAIARRATTRAGGSITLASDVKGTTVTIELPLVAGME